MTMNKTLNLKDVKTNYTCQVKEEEYSPALKIASMHWYDNLRTTFKKSKEKLITATRTNSNNKRINRTTITKIQKWEEKQLYGYFKRQSKSHTSRLRKGYLKRETESLQIAAQNNAIRTNHVEAKIHKTQQNSKCWLSGDRDKTIYHMISESGKLAYKEY